MSRVVLSEAARLDRWEITAYTVERFGIHQARRLRDRFQAALNTLAESPSSAAPMKSWTRQAARSATRS